MISTESTERLVSLVVFGEFTLADYKEFEDVVNYRIQFSGPVDLLFDLRQMAGFTLDVAWEEIKFSRQHAGDFRRIAVLTQDQWLTWSAWVSQLFVTAEVKVFDDEDEARAWLAADTAAETAGSDAVNASYVTLIGAIELAQHLRDADWVVFDCRADLVDPAFGERAYDSAHLPGAFFIDLERGLSGPKTGRNGRHPLPDPASLAARLAACGVGNHSQVVAYDDAGGMFAARLWWMLRWLGHHRVAVLDGGLQAWMAAGLGARRRAAEVARRHLHAGPGPGPGGCAVRARTPRPARTCCCSMRAAPTASAARTRYSIRWADTSRARATASSATTSTRAAASSRPRCCARSSPACSARIRRARWYISAARASPPA